MLVIPEHVTITRLPPGPVPDVPFVDQVRAAPKFACPCGARRRFGDDVTGRCGCKGGAPTWSLDDTDAAHVTDELQAQLRALSDDALADLRSKAQLRAHKVEVLREIGRRRRESNP